VNQDNESNPAGAPRLSASNERSMSPASGQSSEGQQAQAQPPEQTEGVIPKAAAVAEKAVGKALEKSTEVADTTIDKVADAAINALHGGTTKGNVGNAASASASQSSTYSPDQERQGRADHSSQRMKDTVSKATSGPVAIGAAAVVIAAAGAFLWSRRSSVKSSGSRPLMKGGQPDSETDSTAKQDQSARDGDRGAAMTGGSSEVLVGRNVASPGGESNRGRPPFA
jgi:hypothetical protein